MSHHIEKDSSRLSGTEPQRIGAQPDEADGSEGRRSGRKGSTETNPEEEKQDDGLQARPRERAKEASTSSSHQGHNIVGSLYDEPHAEEPGQSPPPLDLEEFGKQLGQSVVSQLPIKWESSHKPKLGDLLVAKHTFTARSSDELTLAKGDKVILLENDDEFGDGWFLGEMVSTDKCGLFPATCTGIKTSRVLERSEPGRTIPIKLWTRSPEPDAALNPEIAKHNRLNNSPNLVCVSCGASWDPRTGCSRSCGGTQVGLGNDRGVDKKLPKKGVTNIPAYLVSKRAITDLGYTGALRQEGRRLVIPEALGEDDIETLLEVSEIYHKSDPEMDVAGSQPGNHVDEGHDDSSEDEIVVIEEHTPPASLHTDFEAVSEFSVVDTDSNASYSAMLSEGSREQPTDPSSWLDSSSADRAGMRGHQVDTTSNRTKQELDGESTVGECSRSISSFADSIGSAVSAGGPLGQAGVNYVVAKFTQSDPELLALYTEASQRLARNRFVDNNRRLLKMFYLDFAREEQTPAQREAVAFFRSRRRRAEISLDIFNAVIPDLGKNYSAEGKEFSMLNAYFENLDAADADKNSEDEQGALESDGCEFEDVGEKPSLDMTSLQAIGEYFVMSRAFSQYKQRLHRFLHPEHEGRRGSAAVQGVSSNREEHILDALRSIEPRAKTLTDTGTDDSESLDNQAQGTIHQAEKHLDEHIADEVRNVPRPEDLHGSLDSSSQIEGHPTFLATWITKWVTDTYCPPLEGSQRIWYFCGCGQHTYIDVKELEPGGMKSEWRSISESSATARRAHSGPSSAAHGGQLPSTPSAVHLGPTSSRNTASPNSPSQGTPQAPPPYPNPAAAISPDLSGATRRDPMFLLICINGKAYKTLAELRCLDIDDSYNDELLIRGILNQYEEARKGYQWSIDLLLPRWMLPSGLLKHFKGLWKAVPFSLWRPSFIQDSLLVQSILEWWSRWASDVSPWAPLHIIDTADFVEFELVPHPEGKEAFPSHFTSGRWPAPDNQQYRYRPVPMKCIKTMNLWHMRRPGPHTEVYWYNTVPKKVDGALYRPSGTVEDVIGYGVRINERLNDVLVLWWSFIFVLVTGVFIYVYSNYTSDNSSAFGMGAYLVAAFTVYIQLQYAWWKRT